MSNIGSNSWIKLDEPAIAKRLHEKILTVSSTDEADSVEATIERALAVQRCQTYRDMIAFVRNYKGHADQSENIVNALSRMIKSEKSLYGLED